MQLKQTDYCRKVFVIRKSVLLDVTLNLRIKSIPPPLRFIHFLFQVRFHHRHYPLAKTTQYCICLKGTMLKFTLEINQIYDLFQALRKSRKIIPWFNVINPHKHVVLKVSQ